MKPYNSNEPDEFLHNLMQEGYARVSCKCPSGFVEHAMDFVTQRTDGIYPVIDGKRSVKNRCTTFLTDGAVSFMTVDAEYYADTFVWMGGMPSTRGGWRQACSKVRRVKDGQALEQVLQDVRIFDSHMRFLGRPVDIRVTTSRKDTLLRLMAHVTRMLCTLPHNTAMGIDRLEIDINGYSFQICYSDAEQASEKPFLYLSKTNGDDKQTFPIAKSGFGPKPTLNNVLAEALLVALKKKSIRSLTSLRGSRHSRIEEIL